MGELLENESDFCLNPCILHWLAKKKKILPGKMKSDLYRLDVAESKNGSRNALSPTTSKGERLKVNNCVFNKRKIITFLKL
jgi:hypothetical protein